MPPSSEETRPPEREGADALPRRTLDSAADFAIVTTDLDGRVIGWNRGAEAVLGWSEVEMLGQPADHIFTPEDQAAGVPEAEMRTAAERGRAADERWHLRRDGSRLWGSGEMMPLRDERGGHVGYLKILRDRTAQHLAGEALETVAERSRLAQRATRDAIWDWDLRANSVLWNEALGDAYGWTPEQVEPTGDWWIAQIHPDDRAGVDESIHAVIEGTGTAWTDEYRFRRADGTYASVLDRGYVIRDPDGAAVRMIGAMFDRSERERAEVALRESEARYRTLFDAMDEGFCVLEFVDGPHGPLSDYVHVEANPAYARHAGIPGIVGRRLREVVGDDEAGSWVARFGAVLRTGQPIRFEQELVATGHHLELSAFRVEPPSRRQVAVLFQDVTARKRAEAELRALNDGLEQRVEERTGELRRSEELLRQSQKMEAVGQLTGGLAHDFNNLLTGIIGALELLSTRVSQGRIKDVERYVTVAQGAARRAAALTHRLLAFSRRQTLDPKSTDANRLIGGMEELIRRTVGPAVELEVVGAGGLWPTLVDPNQLENALLNLAINARDAMPGGGRLTIETANAWLDARAARERDMQPGQYVAIAVSDTGTGMPPEVVARAFDPFFTTKPLGEGTGLGLSMIYGFARQSGGQVRIYTEEGRGTTMRLYLPRHQGPAEEAAAAAALADAPRAGAGQTVLVVDDEPSVRVLVTEVLEELGYAAIEAADAISGLAVLRSDARVDLLVTDVGLPGGMNGRQMADAAREARPDLKVLFITGYAENAAVGNGHLGPGMHVMTKPFAMEALAGRVRELIAAP